jgi:hypothetical protein
MIQHEEKVNVSAHDNELLLSVLEFGHLVERV